MSKKDACRATGPTLAMSAYVRGLRSIAIPWPLAGASTTQVSNALSLFLRRSIWASSQILPSVTSSSRPGAAAVR